MRKRKERLSETIMRLASITDGLIKGNLKTKERGCCNSP